MKPKIRALFLQSQSHGGAMEDVHSTLARHLESEHIEIHVACATYENDEKTATYRMFEAIPDAHIRPTNFGPPKEFQGSKLDNIRNKLVAGLALAGSLVGLIGYIKRHHINIIHTANNKREMFCGVLLAKLTGARCIVHLHLNCGTWMTPFSRWILRQADGIVGVSQFTAQSAPTVGCRPARIYHALNGVDSTRWNCDADGSSIRREFAMPTDIPVFAIIARAVPWKGHELLLQALSTIKEELPDFRLLVVGKDDPRSLPKGSRSYLAVLKEKAVELGIGQQVIFTGPRSDIQAILAASDLYTMPTLEEPCALAILEAMAMKKPVVALDSGGTREVVEDGQSGLLSAPGEREQLAENILSLVNDPVRRRRMGEYARQRIEEYFNPQRLANDVERVYRTVLGEAVEPQAELLPDVETVV